MLLDDAALRARLDPPTLAWRSEQGLRDAAVLVPIVRRAEGDVLVFTLRRADLPAHPGQISVPGGARDPGEDPVTCALRETEEEIGVPRGDMEILGRLPDRVSIASYKVAVFAARLRGEPEYRPLTSEVAEIFELPVARMGAAECWSFRLARSPLARFPRVPAMDLEGRCVWGLTGIILRDFMRCATGFDAGD